jgi:hypothetical protein
MKLDANLRCQMKRTQRHAFNQPVYLEAFWIHDYLGVIAADVPRDGGPPPLRGVHGSGRDLLLYVELYGARYNPPKHPVHLVATLYGASLSLPGLGPPPYRRRRVGRRLS